MRDPMTAASDLRVVAAAIRTRDGMVITMMPPARHSDLLSALNLSGAREIIGPDQQGFLLSDGRFVNRIPAGSIALRSGQIERLKYGGHELYSEDLW